MNKKSPILNNEQHFTSITRSLINSTLNASTLTDKLILSKAAILSKKIRPYPLPHYDQELTKYQHLVQQFLPSLCINIQDSTKLSEMTNTKCQTDLSSQLKQNCWRSSQTQTEKYQKEQQRQQVIFRHTLNGNWNTVQPELRDMELKKNRVSLGDTAASYSVFKNNQQQIINQITSLKNKIKSLQQQKTNHEEKQSQAQSLKSKITSLKSDLLVVNQKKNRWKKKALRYQATINGVKQEHEIFQNQYTQIQQKQ